MKKLLSAPLSPRKIIEYLLLFLLLASVLSAAAYGGYWYGYNLKMSKLVEATPSVLDKGLIEAPISDLEKARPDKNSSLETPTLDETAGWKSYVDTLGRFSLKYPSDWEFRKATYGSYGTPEERHDAIFSFTGEVAPPGTDADLVDYISVLVGTRRNTYKQTPEEYARFYNPSDSLTIEKAEEVTIGGKKGYRLIVSVGGKGRRIENYIPYDENFLVEITVSGRITNEIYLGQVNQILPTFRFLDQE